eukprot:15744_1
MTMATGLLKLPIVTHCKRFKLSIMNFSTQSIKSSQFVSIDHTLKELNRLAQKSNLGYDISAIIIRNNDGIIDTQSNNIQFSTKQFIELFVHPKECYYDELRECYCMFGIPYDELRELYLKEERFKAIDGFRRSLSIENIMICPYGIEYNYDVIDYMNNNLFDASIITMPKVFMEIEDPDNADEYLDEESCIEAYNFNDYIIGAAPTGDLIGFEVCCKGVGV